MLPYQSASKLLLSNCSILSQYFSRFFTVNPGIFGVNGFFVISESHYWKDSMWQTSKTVTLISKNQSINKSFFINKSLNNVCRHLEAFSTIKEKTNRSSRGWKRKFKKISTMIFGSFGKWSNFLISWWFSICAYSATCVVIVPWHQVIFHYLLSQGRFPITRVQTTEITVNFQLDWRKMAHSQASVWSSLS